MAYDPRFAIGFIGSSGEGGAKLHRRNFGELVENLTGSGEYHWMAGNFLKYGGPLTPGRPAGGRPRADRPVRPAARRSSATGRRRARGRGAVGRPARAASWRPSPPARSTGCWARRTSGTSEFPEVETGLTDGDLAFRQHKGGHTTGPNWPTFLAFADRYIKPRRPEAAVRPRRASADDARQRRDLDVLAGRLQPPPSRSTRW